MLNEEFKGSENLHIWNISFLANRQIEEWNVFVVLAHFMPCEDWDGEVCLIISLIVKLELGDFELYLSVGLKLNQDELDVWKRTVS